MKVQHKKKMNFTSDIEVCKFYLNSGFDKMDYHLRVSTNKLHRLIRRVKNSIILTGSYV